MKPQTNKNKHLKVFNWNIVEIQYIYISLFVDFQTVLRENRELQDMTICKVCMVEKVNIVFLPCGHIVTCAECAPAMRKCPMCRKMVMGTIRAFMS